MKLITESNSAIDRTLGKLKKLSMDIVKNRWLYFLLIPGIVFFFIFKYVPMWGLELRLWNITNMTPQKAYG